MNKIEIFDDVMIGTHSIIFPGIKIGSNSIIDAGSAVVKDVSPGTIVGDNPARVIGCVDEFVSKRNHKFEEKPFLPRRDVEQMAEYFWNH